MRKRGWAGSLRPSYRAESLCQLSEAPEQRQHIRGVCSAWKWLGPHTTTLLSHWLGMTRADYGWRAEDIDNLGLPANPAPCRPVANFSCRAMWAAHLSATIIFQWLYSFITLRGWVLLRAMHPTPGTRSLLVLFLVNGLLPHVDESLDPVNPSSPFSALESTLPEQMAQHWLISFLMHSPPRAPGTPAAFRDQLLIPSCHWILKHHTEDAERITPPIQRRCYMD